MNLQFEPWPTCSISTLFWKTLAAKKLNEFRKGRIDLSIKAFYLQNHLKNAQLFFSTESFEEKVTSVAELGANFHELSGKLVLCDTIEEFKALDRSKEALKVAEHNSNCQDIEEIQFFVIFAFADVKRFKFYHQIVYPVQLFSEEQITWIPQEEDANYEEFEGSFKADLSTRTVSFHDSSSIKNVPGWPLRQILVNLSQKQAGEEFTVNLLRSNNSNWSFKAILPGKNKISGVTGWELSTSDPTKVAPIKMTDISSLIDPIQLAKQAGELNLKLMKWRLVPDLDLEIIAKTSCLLVGSGTLGCNILRVLLGWGFRKISLIDSGKVSYSNPVRQSLFTFEDAKNAAPKASTAALRALQIDPNAQIEGFEMTVPMPGHPIINEEETRESFDKLRQLISSHDVIFLLTDSRESRWLPALLGHEAEKIVITVGLGFDSFVVMRHGVKGASPKPSCYFCHDVIGPSDSLSGRSLDQQCTVTRPGLSYMASALSVELLVSLLQFPEKNVPPNSSCRLGRIPHQIRGNLANQETFTLSGTAFEHCTCCSDQIIQEFQKDQFEFVKRACNSPIELENISGLTELKRISSDMNNLCISASDCSDFESEIE